MRETWQSAELAEQFGDLTIFEELRLDPYYRRLAIVYPELGEYLQQRIDACRNRRVSLVHGDWSPKNILVEGSNVLAIDFECIHFGDPSFDAAFLLNHLLLKTVYGIAGAEDLARIFWSTLQAEMPAAPWFEQATLEHLGALLLARIDAQISGRIHSRAGSQGTHSRVCSRSDSGSSAFHCRRLEKICRSPLKACKVTKSLIPAGIPP